MASAAYDPREDHRMGDSPSKATRAQVAESLYRDAEIAMSAQYERSNEPSDARIQAQLGFMQEQLETTQKMFAELTNRLEPILMPELDSAGDTPGPPRKMASEISNTIDDLNGQITRFQHRIGSVTRRVQL